jgi:hypothetical protein
MAGFLLAPIPPKGWGVAYSEAAYLELVQRERRRGGRA